MTAQTEVSKEVSVIDGKSGLEMNSYHDLTKPDSNGINHCDQANDPDNSYVFVTRADGLIDDPRYSQAEVVAGKGYSVEAKAAGFEVQEGKLDVVNGESKSLKEGGIGNVKGTDEVPPAVTVNGVPSEQEKFPVGGDVVLSAVADAPGLQNGKTQLQAEAQFEQIEDSNGRWESSAEIKKVGDQNENIKGAARTETEKVEDSNPKLGSPVGAVIQKVVDQNDKLNGVIETEIRQVEDSKGRIESSDGADMERVADQKGQIEPAETEIKEVGDSNVTLESSATAAMEKVAEQNGNIPDVVENGIKRVEGSIGTLVILEGSAMETVVDQNEKNRAVVETEIKEVEDSKGKLESSAGGLMENTADQNGITEDAVENEIKEVEDSNGRLESSVGGAVENMAVQNAKLKAVVETEIKEVEDSKGRLESSAGAEIENVADQNGTDKDVVETEIQQVDDSNRKLESWAEALMEKGVDQNEKIIDVVETEIKQVEDTTERLESSAGAAAEKVADKIESSAGIGETEMKLVEDSNGRLESLAGTLVDQDEKIKDNIETKQVEDSNGRLESSGEAAMKKVADQSEKLNGVVETEIKHFENSNGRLENSVEAANQKVADQKGKSEDVVASEIRQGEELIGRLESSVAAVEKAGDQDEKTEDVAENSVKQVKNQDGRFESWAGAEINKVVDQNGKLEDLGETEIKRVEDVDGRLESSVGRVLEKDKNEIIEDAVEMKLENIKDQRKSESSPAPVENQEPRVVALRLVTETKENEEVNKLLSRRNDAGNTKDACSTNDARSTKDAHEDQYYLDSTDTSEECQESQKVVVGAIEHDVSTEDQNEVKLTRELVESVDHEVRPAASMDSHLESCSINNKEETLKEEAERALGSDVMKIRECDAAPVLNVQEGLEQPDETKTMVSIDDCNVETVSDLGLEGRNKEDLLVSHVEDGVQNAEEPEKQSDDHGVSPEIVQSETVTEAFVPANNASDFTGDQLVSAKGSINENLLLKENEDTGKSRSNHMAMASSEGSSLDAIPGANTSIAAVTNPFTYLVRIPRFNDEILEEQIRLAKLDVDEKTKLRDAIQKQIQEKRANSQTIGVDFEYAKGEDRSARKLVRSKRMEIDSLQSVISKAKNAISIEDIDSRIYNMEHMIQHETLPLKEEKQFIREIKQLKQLREQLSSNMGSQDEIKQALEQKKEAEDRVKILRKELDILKENVSKTGSAAAGAERKYDDEYNKVRELQAQFRAANDVRQEAYVRWQSLRKELSDKNKHFFEYKNDAATANNHAFRRDRVGLYRHCVNQVEKFMDMWNTNDEFRREYTKFNARSTVRRLETLDGRALGPDEERPILPSYVDERGDRIVSVPAKVDSILQSPPEIKRETIEEYATDDKSKKKLTEHKNQAVKTKAAAKTASGNGLATVSGRDSLDEVQEEPVKSKEEIELERKAEEKRKIEAEAKLKEQRRMEELAKANEARERKKRQAEKVQMRAEVRAQKEAEQKEKEREKRLRKKERKNAAAMEVNHSNSYGSAPSSESVVETSKELEAKPLSTITTKKPKKASNLTKQSKTKPIPPSLRNRNRKKWQQYAWVGAIILLVSILFWLGNLGIFSDVNLRGFY